MINESFRVPRRALLLCLLAVPAVSCARGMKPRRVTPGAVREYYIPWKNAFPSDVVVDSTGLLWFTDRLTHRIASFDYRTNRFHSYATPTKKSAPYGVALDPDGSIWFAESAAGRIGHLDPRTRKITEFEIAGAKRGPQQIAVSNGRIWFGLRDAMAYGWLDPRTGETRLTSVPFMKPYSVAVTPDGDIWMSAYEQWMLLRIDGETQQADTIYLPRQRGVGYSMRRLASDRTGRIWITSFASSGLSSFTPSDATLRRYSQGNSYGVTVDSRGRVWFSSPERAQVVAMDPASMSQQTYQMSTPHAYVRNIAVDYARGRVWLPMSDSGRIGLILFDRPQ